MLRTTNLQLRRQEKEETQLKRKKPLLLLSFRDFLLSTVKGMEQKATLQFNIFHKSKQKVKCSVSFFYLVRNKKDIFKSLDLQVEPEFAFLWKSSLRFN